MWRLKSLLWGGESGFGARTYVFRKEGGVSVSRKRRGGEVCVMWCFRRRKEGGGERASSSPHGRGRCSAGSFL
jgi:hypothetical protein